MKLNRRIDWFSFWWRFIFGGYPPVAIVLVTSSLFDKWWFIIPVVLYYHIDHCFIEAELSEVNERLKKLEKANGN